MAISCISQKHLHIVHVSGNNIYGNSFTIENDNKIQILNINVFKLKLNSFRSGNRSSTPFRHLKWIFLFLLISVVPGKQCVMLPGTERNVNTGVLMLWNGTSGNITHVLCSQGTLYMSLTT